MIGIRVGYIRVSSDDQNPERQLEKLKVDKSFLDIASGKNTKRPQFQALMDFIRQGDTLVVHSMDRLARNLVDLRNIVQSLVKRGIRVEFMKENLAFTGEDSPMSILLLSMMGAFAEFERSIIRERQAEGIALAKKRGEYSGRKPALNKEQVLEILQRIQSGEKKSLIAKALGIGRSTLYKYICSCQKDLPQVS